MIEATFSVRDRQGERVEEAELGAGLPGSALLNNLGITEGILRITDPATGTQAEFGDTLPVLIGAFCLRGLEALVNDGSASVDFLDHEEVAELVLDAQNVTLSSPRIGTRQFARAGYVRALAACGGRYVATMASLWAGDPGRAQSVAALQGSAAAVAQLG